MTTMVIDLADVDSGLTALVGGKAAGLGDLLKAGERVPAGFCITTKAFGEQTPTGEIADELRTQIVAAYERLGAGPVAVRSSATAEDLAFASFAGQHETVLNVRGVDELIDAVRTCWASLSSPRAVAYREAAGFADVPVFMGVVVQRMVDAAQAGVLFTANPITGTRTQMVVDAVAGLGDVVVDGSVQGDHYVLTAGDIPASADGCLSLGQLHRLREVGERVQRLAGRPQDIEWAFDRHGILWLLQARAITTLFPLPPPSAQGPRVLLEVGHMQGMLRPFTPMGMSVMRVAYAHWLHSVGLAADPFRNETGVVDVAGRMYLNLTPYVRSRSVRTKLAAAMQVYGPRVSAAVAWVVEDPRFTPTTRWPYRPLTVVSVAAHVVPGLITGVMGALASPRKARRRAFAAAAELRECRLPEQLATAERVRLAAQLQRSSMRAMMTMLPPLYAALFAKAAAARLLEGLTADGEVEETLRGMPHNVTTEMDLELWRLARVAGTRAEYRDLLLDTPPHELGVRHCAGQLPDIGLGAFLDRYGHRGAAEIDIGVPRWAEDPAPVFAAIAGYLRVSDPQQAADRRFTLAAAEAAAKIEDLVVRARRTRPIRARLAGFFLRRSRALAGVRELPKFAMLYVVAQMRAQLRTAGAELSERGLLEGAGDIMFLDLPEALAAAGGTDLRDRVAVRRAEYEREMRRRSVPGVLLSDGTIPEALAPRAPAVDGALVGMAAAPGQASGRARVVRDPATAHIEPGEILIAATTDPGWTPLFLTAGGLVTETGSPMAHGPTVAREYGIPAVICVADATQLIADGQLITVDGAAGTVVVADEGSPVPHPVSSPPRLRDDARF